MIKTTLSLFLSFLMIGSALAQSGAPGQAAAASKGCALIEMDSNNKPVVKSITPVGKDGKCPAGQVMVDVKPMTPAAPTK